MTMHDDVLDYDNDEGDDHVDDDDGDDDFDDGD
jgi:hypothetical protein